MSKLVIQDDNFSKDNFTVKPEHDGAFICLNSWGTNWGEGGYFYESYDCTDISEPLQGVLNTEDCVTENEYTYVQSFSSESEYLEKIDNLNKNWYGVVYKGDKEVTDYKTNID